MLLISNGNKGNEKTIYIKKRNSYCHQHKLIPNVAVVLILPTLPLECQKALGMESGTIVDSQLSASSSFNYYGAAGMGRLHNAEGGAAWRAATNDSSQWLQVDLDSYYTRITRIATQGRHGAGWIQWVIEYKLQHSQDGVSFQYYREQGQTTEKVIYGNFIETNVSRKEIALLKKSLKRTVPSFTQLGCLIYKETARLRLRRIEIVTCLAT